MTVLGELLQAAVYSLISVLTSQLVLCLPQWYNKQPALNECGSLPVAL
jgi:hypothetical protein